MATADAYSQIAKQIITGQEVIIGPIALEQAKSVPGLEVVSSGNVSIVGDGKIVLSKLVDQYAKLFGRASIEVCKEAVRESKSQIPTEELPEVLR